MSTGFHGNSNPIHIFKALRYAAFGRSEAALFQHAVMTPLVSWLQSNGGRSNQYSPG